MHDGLRYQTLRSSAVRGPGDRSRRAHTAAARLAAELQAAQEIGDLTRRDLTLAYWCEGAEDKPHRRAERVCLVSGDITLMRIFPAFLECCGVDRSELSVRVHIRQGGDLETAHEFWACGLRPDPGDFRPPVIERYQPKAVYDAGRAYHGCLRIDVPRSSDLYRRVDGWFAAALTGGRGVERKRVLGNVGQSIFWK
ncbi:hypothetical protein [Thermomonospora cellulosilytica]|uniref:Uncharacterized protein n=1 Tax=Thermomonospora cellulosilytica TaxID=1411118 RepID=A0A7W3R8Q2_9ACTN|nr:hypothetical protein [Thermomonospora cellulosilytica]MBA9003540.1 hypothetical protein [Thermomonospora cellulosilytica]